MEKMFVFGGLLLTVTLGALFAFIFTGNIKNNVARLIIGIIVAFVIGYGVIYLISLDYKTDERNYNNGICSICNEKLDLFDIEYHRGYGDEYFYKCENNHLVRTSHYFD